MDNKFQGGPLILVTDATTLVTERLSVIKVVAPFLNSSSEESERDVAKGWVSFMSRCNTVTMGFDNIIDDECAYKIACSEELAMYFESLLVNILYDRCTKYMFINLPEEENLRRRVCVVKSEVHKVMDVVRDIIQSGDSLGNEAKIYADKLTFRDK